MSIGFNRVLSQLELSEIRSINTGLASYRLLDPSRPWFLLGVDGKWDIMAIKSISKSTDWDQKVGLLSIRHGTIDAEIEGWNEGAFMIRCESHERERIAPFVADLCTRLDPNDPVDSALRIIDEWSDLWNRIKGPLGLESQRGLIGELLCLKSMIKSIGNKAIRYWTGPTRAPQDFIAETWRVEVKTIGTKIARPKISSLDQLLPSDEYSLHLILMSIKDGTEFSLNDLVEQIRHILSDHDAFEDLLFQVGYYTKHVAHYTRKYDFTEATYYEITSDSNVLHSGMFSRGIPAIERLEWVLRSEEFPFTRLPEDFWSTL